MIKKIFLVGNPNVGKSVVFSRLTGVHVIASNYPGTTVEVAKGFLKLADGRAQVIDLPGAYSLEPSSKAEEVAVSLLRGEDKDEIVVINVVDATNLERNLFLTFQLIEEGYPVLICLNMCDEMAHRGISIDTDKLESVLGVGVVPVCAVTGSGIRHLIDRIAHARPSHRSKTAHQERWQQIGRTVETVQRLSHRHHTLRELLEDASVRPATGFIMAAACIWLAFVFVRVTAEFLINRVFDPLFFNFYQPFLDKLSVMLGQKGFLHHLLIGELINGGINFQQSLGLFTTAPYIELAMVLPYVISFYFALSVLEDIGYLPRLALLLDNLLHRLGLHGFAIIPVLLGFGCNVPGILATRSMESRRERFIATTLISIGVPCVALQAMIFAMLGKFGGLYVAGVYFVLLGLWLLLGAILNRTLKGFSPELLIEIPPYRMPSPGALFRKMFFRIKAFLIEAFPFVLLGVLLMNVLLFFRAFVFVGNIFSPVIMGLFGLPKEAVIALLIGFLRKDVAAGMLLPLGMTAKQLFISAVLMSVSFPCIATFAVVLKELGIKDLMKAILIMVIVSLAVGSILNFAIPR